ncbi:MAG: hypothetical protein GXY41_01640 [Phycisphaerae bacterium]|nr:hypothetical protein [Phycisphaerae bacterium]
MNVKPRIALIIAYYCLSTAGVFPGKDVLAADRTVTSLKNIDSRANRVYQQVKVPDLPDQNFWRLGLTVNETIMTDPKKATRKGMGVSKNEYLRDEWIGCQSGFYAQYLLGNPELPADLPAEMKQSLEENFKRWGTTEAEAEVILAGKLKSYRKSKERFEKGQIDISIVNAPSPQAAFEYLIVHASSSTLPDEAIVYQFADESIVSDLGTIGYLSDARGSDSICFIRDNIAVIIRGHGEFEREVVDIAQKIDTMLLQQPLLTYEQLQARCPKLHIGSGKKAAETTVPFLEYSVEVPSGVQAWVSDIKINEALIQ